MLARFVMALALITAAWHDAEAQWGQLPSGEWGLTFDYAVTGTFICPIAMYVPGAVCTTAANTIRFTTGASWGEMRFDGQVSRVTASAISTLVTIGQISTSTGGMSPFAWPKPIPQIPLFLMTLRINGAGNGAPRGWIRSSDSSLQPACPEGCVDFSFVDLSGQNTTPPLPHLSGFPLFNNISMSSVDFYNSPTTLVTSEVGLVPEPSTYALMAFGLGVLGVVARRRPQT
ncbi:MAG: PEP-CTERM sorting domain-containing protein [Gemmatimonas sp.]